VPLPGTGDVVTGCSSRGLLGRPQRSYLFAMSSMPPAYLRAELVTPSKSEAAEMPTLRGFDEEFGQAVGVTQLDRTRSILLAVSLGAAILGGLTLAWLAVDGSVRPKVALSAPTSPRNTAPAESRELVERLLSQVEALKSEVRELTEAQQQPACNLSTTRSARGCHPCLRYDLSPMCPGWTPDWLAGHVGFEPANLSASYLTGIPWQLCLK
jgi:hypothetical protein